MENKLPPLESALPSAEADRAGAEVLDLCVRRPSPPLPPALHDQPLRFQAREQICSPPAARWHSPSASPVHARSTPPTDAPAHWPSPPPSAAGPSPPPEPLARPAAGNTFVLQQQLQAPPVMHVAPMPVQQQQQQQQPASGHAFPGAPQEQSQQPKLHRVRILSSSPPRYVTRPLCLADSPYYVPDLHARSPPLPLPAQSSTSPTPSCSAAGQRPLQLAPSASASASGLGFQEAVPLMLPLASQVLSAGASGGGGSGGRGGKPTRPFKAYPRDPLSLTAGLQVSDALLPDANERNERFMVFRHHILSQTAGGAVQRRASGGSGAGVKRPASPAQQPSSSDAQTGDDCSRAESPPSKAVAVAAASDDGKSQLQQQQQKDSAYYERRRRNNEAAKRSRDARRAKEDEVAIRAAFLEQENLELRFELSTLRAHALRWQQMHPHIQLDQQLLPPPPQLQQHQLPQQILPPVNPRAHPQMAVCWPSSNA